MVTRLIPLANERIIAQEKRLQEEEAIRQAAFAEANLPENEKLAKEATEEERIIIQVCSRHARKMHEISPDGHCLYAAIADQISCDSLIDYSPQKPVQLALCSLKHSLIHSLHRLHTSI